MPYPSGHRDKVRARIVDSARRLFNRHGFNNVSIAQIMAGAKLTHGAFYSYFNSKSDLYADALTCFFTDPNWKHCWEGVTVRIDAPDAGAQMALQLGGWSKNGAARNRHAMKGRAGKSARAAATNA